MLSKLFWWIKSQFEYLGSSQSHWMIGTNASVNIPWGMLLIMQAIIKMKSRSESVQLIALWRLGPEISTQRGVVCIHIFQGHQGLHIHEKVQHKYSPSGRIEVFWMLLLDAGRIMCMPPSQEEFQFWSHQPLFSRFEDQYLSFLKVDWQIFM